VEEALEVVQPPRPEARAALAAERAEQPRPEALGMAVAVRASRPQAAQSLAALGPASAQRRIPEGPEARASEPQA